MSNTVARMGSKPLKLGQKQVFLPNFVLTFIRTPHHSPTFASFIVPLNFNKLDLRDYLWNAYGVAVRGVRSYVQLQKLSQDKPGAIRVAPRRWYRPRSIKRMMVEMEQPFIWPKEPETFEKWDKKRYDDSAKQGRDFQDNFNPESRKKPTPERKSIAEQAKKIMEEKRYRVAGQTSPAGDRKKNRTPNARKAQWENLGQEKEVEKDVTLP